MKKQFLNLGKALNKVEQKQIFGGIQAPLPDEWCTCNNITWCTNGNNTYACGWSAVIPRPACCDL